MVMSEDFKRWFEREWLSYRDKAFTSKVTARAWALKAWKFLSVDTGPSQGTDVRPVAIYLGRIETGDGTEAWVELADEDRQYWRDTVRSVYATRDAAPSDAVVWQETDEEGTPLWGENTFAANEGTFEHERALGCIAASAPMEKT